VFPVFLSFGSNLEEREACIQRAVTAVEGLRNTAVTRTSSLWETEPWGKRDQPRFLNQVAELYTESRPIELLRRCKSIEKELGRKTAERWGPRKIDIDILLWGDIQLSSDELQLPHPRLSERKFVLVPLHELAAELVVPGLNKKVTQLLEECTDRGRVRKY